MVVLLSLMFFSVGVMLVEYNKTVRSFHNQLGKFEPLGTQQQEVRKLDNKTYNSSTRGTHGNHTWYPKVDGNVSNHQSLNSSEVEQLLTLLKKLHVSLQITEDSKNRGDATQTSVLKLKDMLQVKDKDADVHGGAVNNTQAPQQQRLVPDHSQPRNISDQSQLQSTTGPRPGSQAERPEEKVLLERSGLWRLSVAHPDHPCVVDCVSGQPIKCYSPNFNPNPIQIDLPTGVRETGVQRKASFSDIYHKKMWLGPNVPRDPGMSYIQSSGTGSLLVSSINIRTVLLRVVEEIRLLSGKNTVTMLDAPCGDMVWMEKFLETQPHIQYVGIDIVPELIQYHKVKYQGRTNWSFHQGDIVSAGMIRQQFDLIFTRHMTQHLTNEDTTRVLKHFSDSGSTFLLATTFPLEHKSTDVHLSSGRFRPQNLEIPPYKLTPPICLSLDIVPPENAYIALWKLPLEQITSCGYPGHPLYMSPHRRFISCV